MDAGSVSMEAQVAVEILRKDSIATPVIQTDNGSAFISLEFKVVLRENRLTHSRIHLSSKRIRESMESQGVMMQIPADPGMVH